MNEKQILLQILDLLKKNFEKFNFKKELPGVGSKKQLVYYYNSKNKMWTPFKHEELTIRKALGYYFANTPESLELDGWSPLRINEKGELVVENLDNIITKNTEIDTVLDLIKTAVDAIKLQTDKLAFTGANSTLIVHETVPT
ncbi:hypothetical protein ES702_06198 [subsurface metagenome]